MFNALRDIPVVAETPKKIRLKRGMSLRAFRAAHKQMLVSSKIVASLAKSGNVVADYSDLRRLRGVAKSQGLTKALMLFANPNNNVISRIAKNIPANESLDAVSIGKSDRRTKAALEGMDEALQGESSMVADWTRASAADIQDLLSSVEDQMKDIGEAISHYLQALENTTPETEESTDAVEAVSYAASAARLDALLEILPDMDALVSDPTDRDAMDIYKARLTDLVTKLGPMTGFTIDPENPHLLCAGPCSEEYMPRTGSMTELGYTLENTIELLKKADQVVDEVNGLIERKEQMVSHLNTTADVIASTDNTVPPAVDDAITDDDDSDTSMGSGLTQADVYHSQVASHLYCLSVIVSASVEAVQEVLVIASELSDDDNDDDVVIVGEITE